MWLAPLRRALWNAATVFIAAALVACGSNSGTGSTGTGSSTLSQTDARELAELAAITYGTPEYQVQGCQFDDASNAVCAVSIRFADNPANPQSCVMQVRVWTVAGQSEGAQLRSGNYGSYEPLNQAECDAARDASGY